MSNLHRSAEAGQVVSLAKSAQYWVRRAQQHLKRGEHRRAAALLRHAVDLDPVDRDLRMEYAQVLREMSCFEASNRVAFGALAQEPTGFAPYQIIGQNMLSLGREQEAIDAFSHYFRQARAEGESLWDWDDEFYELEDMLEAPSGQHERTRLDTLIHIASLRLARGELARAEKALARARRLSSGDERLHALSAMLYEAREQPEKALRHAVLSVARNPHNVPALCALASVRLRLGQRGLSAATLMRAALSCRYPQDEQLFCFSASALGMPELALAMLRLSKQKQPHRLPTLYNYAVALLKTGKAEEALAYLHRCRDLDPEDLTVQALFRMVTQWTDTELPAQTVQENARELSCYPYPPFEAVQGMLLDLGEEFAKGMDSVAQRLEDDDRFYHAFLYALSLPTAPLIRLIYPVASALAQKNPAHAERLLRDMLVQSAQSDEGKRYALSTLITLGAKPPYVMWQSGRILQLDGGRDLERPPSVVQRYWVRRIRAAARKAGDARVTLHALTLLSRMNRQERYAFAADATGVWITALLRHFGACTGASLSPAAQEGPEAPSAKRTESVYGLFCRRMPLAGPDPMGGVSLRIRRKPNETD